MDEIVLSTLGHTWILDLDGTVVKHNGYKLDGEDSFLPGAEQFLRGIPEKDKKSPIVGRWAGIEKNASVSFGIQPVTYVFRSDGTGYQLYGREIYQSFAYTVDAKNGSELQLTIYKYDTGFYIRDGFWKEGDWTYSYVQQPTPKGKKMKAKVYNDDNSLELQGWTNLAADQSLTPIVFQRVSR